MPARSSDQVVVTVRSDGGAQDPHTLCGGSLRTTAEIQRHPVLQEGRGVNGDAQRSGSARRSAGCSWTRVRRGWCRRTTSCLFGRGTPALCVPYRRYGRHCRQWCSTEPVRRAMRWPEQTGRVLSPVFGGTADGHGGDYTMTVSRTRVSLLPDVRGMRAVVKGVEVGS